MDYDKLFGFLICSVMPVPPTLSSSRLQSIVNELGQLGYLKRRLASRRLRRARQSEATPALAV